MLFKNNLYVSFAGGLVASAYSARSSSHALGRVLFYELPNSTRYIGKFYTLYEGFLHAISQILHSTINVLLITIDLLLLTAREKIEYLEQQP